MGKGMSIYVFKKKLLTQALLLEPSPRIQHRIVRSQRPWGRQERDGPLRRHPASVPGHCDRSRQQAETGGKVLASSGQQPASDQGDDYPIARHALASRA